MSTLFNLTATAACIVTAGMASAQSDDVTASGTHKAADEVKCHEIVMMDTAVVPGTLYYIAGYHNGNQKAMGGETGASDASATDGSTAGASDTDASGGATDDTAATGTDTGSSDLATDTTDSNATAGSGDASMDVAQISGFYEIPVEDVLTVCTDEPDRKVSDVVNEKRDSAKSETQSDTQ